MAPRLASGEFSTMASMIERLVLQQRFALDTLLLAWRRALA